MNAEEERCSWCGTDAEAIGFELNKLQSLVEMREMSEGTRLRCLDHIFEIRLMLKERSNLVVGPWKLDPFMEG